MILGKSQFANKLVMISQAKIYDFLWLDRSLSYLSNAFWITSFWVVWKTF